LPDENIKMKANHAGRRRQDKSPDSPDRAESNLIRSARRIMLAIGVIVALMQIIQHFSYTNLRINLFLFAEIIFYVVVLPLSGAWLLNILTRSEHARSQASQILTEKYALVRSLTGTSEWNDLVQRVVEFPRFVLPLINSSLYLFNEKSQEFELAAYWGQGENSPEGVRMTFSGAECDGCASGRHEQFHLVSAEPGRPPLYCLPLCLDDRAWGLIRMHMQPGKLPLDSQVEVLNAVSTDLALVLDRAMLRTNALSQAAASEAVRHQIAHELHDTLAQNIAYLRLKLEELLLEENPSRQISLIRRELGRMRDTANEAYAQVRETLADLQISESKDLLAILKERAQASAQRAHLEVTVEQRGTPPAELDPLLKRQVIYTCREALTNIERHSRASRAEVTISWEPNCLAIRISDNGLGFDPRTVDAHQHYGLNIMRERIESVGGEMYLQSDAGLGTTITFTVPQPASGPESIPEEPKNGDGKRGTL
jgi:signal transduction histidine kinase